MCPFPVPIPARISNPKPKQLAIAFTGSHAAANGTLEYMADISQKPKGQGQPLSPGDPPSCYMHIIFVVVIVQPPSHSTLFPSWQALGMKEGLAWARLNSGPFCSTKYREIGPSSWSLPLASRLANVHEGSGHGRRGSVSCH